MSKIKYPHKDIKDTFTIKHTEEEGNHYLIIDTAINSNHESLKVKVSEDFWNTLRYNFARITNGLGVDYLTYAIAGQEKRQQDIKKINNG